MKRSLLFVLALSTFAFTGCAPGFYNEVDERLTALPIEPHNNEIEVLFAGEWPQEEYIKVAALETRAGENVPYIDLIKNLKAKARRYGADAVLVQEKGFIADVSTQVFSRRVETTSTGVLTGIAKVGNAAFNTEIWKDKPKEHDQFRVKRARSRRAFGSRWAP